MILDTKKPSQAQIDALLREWEKDAKLDHLEPSDELKKIGSLHSKYLSILSAHRRAFKEASRTFAKLKRIKYEYYTGKLDADTLKQYGWQPFLYTLKGDLALYMDSDPDILGAKRLLDIHEEITQICESIIKELGARTWQLKEICGWEKFIRGG